MSGPVQISLSYSRYNASRLDVRGDDVSETRPFSGPRACVARLVRAELFGENPGIEERPEMHNDDAFALGILVPV